MNTLSLFVIFLTTLFIVPSVHASEGFLAQFAGQQTVAGENAIAVTFSKRLDTRQNINPYLGIFKDKDLPVEGAWVLAESGWGFDVKTVISIKRNTGKNSLKKGRTAIF